MRRHHGPARRKINPATINVEASPTGTPDRMKHTIKTAAQASAGSS